MNSALPEVQIRRMAAADLDRVLEIAANLPAAPAWPRLAYLEALHLVAEPAAAVPRLALVAVAPPSQPDLGPSGTIPAPNPPSVQGFAVASLLPPQAELETFAVAASNQRRGFGRLLLAALVAELTAAGVRELRLEVRASNQPAIAFYLAAGFQQTGRRARYYAQPAEDAVLMSARLG